VKRVEWPAVTGRHNHTTPAAPSPQDGAERLVEATYRTIVADPPWRYSNRASRGAAENHYPTLSVGQLCGTEAMPDGSKLNEQVREWSADDGSPISLDNGRLSPRLIRCHGVVGI
jgi:hypothetical protein